MPCQAQAHTRTNIQYSGHETAAATHSSLETCVEQKYTISKYPYKPHYINITIYLAETLLCNFKDIGKRYDKVYTNIFNVLHNSPHVDIESHNITIPIRLLLDFINFVGQYKCNLMWKFSNNKINPSSLLGKSASNC